MTCFLHRIFSQKKNILWGFILICSIVFGSQATLAESFKGRLRKIDGVKLLVSKNQIAYELNFMSPVSRQQISRLSDGDFISVSGTKDPEKPNLINVITVDYVGLALLMGVWRSDNDLCYEFAGFNKLYVYLPYRAKDCKAAAESIGPSKYTYFINPDVGTWNLLISSSDSNFFGELEILNSNHIEIMLFDSETDANLGKVILRR